MMTEDATRALLAELTDDRDTVDLPDGRTVRLVIEHDPDTTLIGEGADFDCYGKLEWRDMTDRYGEGHWPARPDGFDGNAEVLCAPSSDPVWWQPAEGSPARGTREFVEMRRGMLELLEFGFRCVGIEVLETCDCCDVTSVRGSAWIGGVDDATGDYLQHLLVDLFADAMAGGN